MLELKNVNKTYRPKKSAETKALVDVSITFPDKGLVFILGKSGCGKSTLLNVIGGLDKPDSGEISIMGRSSKDFSPTDFDSYRNTFVGFVFQEYNVLDEFTVEDNIAIATELQGKKRDRARISEILRQFELEGLERRKPNTLSGGQKQRVAIARAHQKSAHNPCRRAHGLARFRYGQRGARYPEKAVGGKARHRSIPRQGIRGNLRRPHRGDEGR